MEKDNDSMATVQMKPEYAASEVYSTVGSEPPPAYKMRNSNSVQITKIIAGTVIIASVIIGLFILGSTYVQARASCNYMDSLQAAMDKELLLEKYDDYPRAEAFHDGDSTGTNTNHISSSDRLNAKRHDKNNIDSKSESDTDSSYSDSDESDELNRVQIKLPLDLDLGDIANAILETNQKSRMNCVVERRRAEEVVDAPARTMQLPFGLNLTTDQKKQKITGERMVIICESGSEQRNENDEAEQMRPIVIPLNAIPLQFGPRGQQFPITHLPNQMPPQEVIQQIQQQAHIRQMMQQEAQIQQAQQAAHMHQMQQQQEQQAQMHHMQQQQAQEAQMQQMQQQQSHIRQMLPPQFFQQIAEEQQVNQLPPQPQQLNQMRPEGEIHQLPIHQLPPQPPIPAQMMQAPEPEVRIQLHRVQVPAPVREMQGRGEIPPQYQVQQLPLAVALQRAGITAAELRNFQRMAEERIHEELRQFVSEEAADSSDSSASEDSSEEQDSSLQQQQHQQQQQHMQPEILGRTTFGRSLVTPVRIPVPMMQQDAPQESQESQERTHYLHPRSVRSADDVLLHREKRVKRCACDCSC